MTKTKTFPANFSGEFVDRPLLDRLNPFTPFNKKKFVPSEQAQDLLNEYQTKYGKKIRVLPTQTSDLGGADAGSYGGLFKPFAVRGGSFDPFERYVYLNPTYEKIRDEKGKVIDTKPARTFVLAHELGHAFDPNLKKSTYRGELPTGIKRIAGGIIDALTKDKTDFDKRTYLYDKLPNFNSRADAYNFFGKHAMEKFTSELDAQKAAKDFFDSRGIKDSSASGYMEPLDVYPASYLIGYDRGITDPNYAQGIGQLNPVIGEYRAASPSGRFGPAVRAVQKSVDSDVEYQKAKRNLLDRARNYAKNLGLYSGDQ